MTYILDAYLYMNKTKPFSKKDERKRKEKLGTHKECDPPKFEDEEDEVQKESGLSSIMWDSQNMKFFKDAIDLASSVTESKVVEFRKHIDEKKLIANQISSWLDETIGKKARFVFLCLLCHIISFLLMYAFFIINQHTYLIIFEQ